MKTQDRIRPARYQPHVINTDTFNLSKSGHSPLWSAVLVLMFFIEANFLVLGFFTLTKNIIFKIWIFNAVSIFSVIALLVVFVCWLFLAGNQKRLDETIEMLLFNKRVRKGVERISIFDEKVKEEEVRSITGYERYDPETGIGWTKVNEMHWSIKDHPYRGNNCVTYVAYSELEESEETTIIENMYEADNALKIFDGGIYKNTTMIISESMTFALKDYEKKLSSPKITKTEEQALYSIIQSYKGRKQLSEPYYLIHVGLPFTVHKETALRNLQKLENGFIKALDDRKIKTVRIRNPNFLASIIKGTLTCKLMVRREYDGP